MTRRTAQDSMVNTAKPADKVSADFGRNPDADLWIFEASLGLARVFAQGFVAPLANIGILAAARFAP